jgi:hypothetical protein
MPIPLVVFVRPVRSRRAAAVIAGLEAIAVAALLLARALS